MLYNTVALTPQQKNIIETEVLGSYFPWYYVEHQTIDICSDSPQYSIRPAVETTNAPHLSHQLLTRASNLNQSHYDRAANDYSSWFDFFYDIFHNYCVANNISYSKIYRANLNLNWYNGPYHTKPHLDHDWYHHNFIMYLTTCPQAETLIWPDDFTVTHLFPCIAYNAVSFKQQYHAHRFPTLGSRRVVFVVTYI